MVTLRAKIDLGTFPRRLQNIERGLTGAGKRKMLLGAAQEFAALSRKAIGPSGTGRAIPWKPLTKNYAHWKFLQVGRTKADLLLSGDLLRSIRAECNNDNFSVVSANTPYAAAHQLGLGRQPPRPYMPLWAGQLTPHARARILAVVENYLRRLAK